METKELRLSLKTKWYKMIESGEKKEEYREINPYWCSRLLYHVHLPVKGYWGECPNSKENTRGVLQRTLDTIEENKKRYPDSEKLQDLNTYLINEYGIRGYTHVHFTLGYPKADDTSRHMVKKIKEIVIAEGKPEWGAEPGKKYFVIRLYD